MHAAASTTAEGFLSSLHSSQRCQHRVQHVAQLAVPASLHIVTCTGCWRTAGWAVSAQQQQQQGVLAEQEVLLVLPARQCSSQLLINQVRDGLGSVCAALMLRLAATAGFSNHHSVCSA